MIAPVPKEGSDQEFSEVYPYEGCITQKKILMRIINKRSKRMRNQADPASPVLAGS